MLIAPDHCIEDIEHSFFADMHSWSSNKPGLFRLTRKDSVFYCITIMHPGDGGGLHIYDGFRRLVWPMPSAFTGSFVVNGYCQGGIIVDNGYGRSMGSNISINWRE